VRWPAVKVVDRGVERRDILYALQVNNRIPSYIGDLRAQIGAAQLAESTLVCGSWQSEPSCRPQRSNQRKSRHYPQQSERKCKITRGAKRVGLARRRRRVAQQDGTARSTHAGSNRGARRYGGMA